MKGLFGRKPKEPKLSRKQARAAAAAAAAAAAEPNIAELFQQTTWKGEVAPTQALPRFQSTATDNLGRGRMDRFAQARLRVRDAFAPSQPVSDRRFFAGRQQVLAQMIRAIEDQRQHLVLYGDRGIGKTSLLHIMAEAAREARYIVVYWSCGAASNFDETFRAAAAEVPLLFHSGFAPTAAESEAGSSLADLLPTSPISPRVFGELCAKITGTRVLVILDEFDRAESAVFRREIAELIKMLSDRSARLELIIAGVAADLAELVEHIPSIRRNIQTFRIPPMSAEEIKEIVDTGTRGSGIPFLPASKDYVVSAACGSPYLAALICHHASLAALDARRTEVLVEDVVEGVGVAITELDHRLPRSVREHVNRLRSKGAGRPLAVMAAAALAGGGEFDQAAIEEAAASASEATLCKRVCSELVNGDGLVRGIDSDGHLRYSFAEEGLQAYLWLLNIGDQRANAEESGRRASAG